jgi:hypothetical protein
MQLHLHEADVGLPTQPLYMAVLMDVEGAAGHSLPTRQTLMKSLCGSMSETMLPPLFLC